MKTENALKKNSVLLLSGLMLLFLSVLFWGTGINADAAGTKATLKDKTLTRTYGDTYCPIIIQNWNPKAKYTFSVSPRDSAEVTSLYESQDDASQAEAGVIIKKKGTIKVTVKETVDKKTRNVGTCTIKVSGQSELYLPFIPVEIKKGQTYNVYELGNLSSRDGLKFSIADKSIATINKYGVITAKKEGSTTLTVRQGTNSAKADLTVISGSFTSKDNKKIDQLKSKTEALCKKKITAGNYTSWYNEYYSLSKEWEKYRDYNCILQINGRYTINDCRQKLADFMKTRTKHSVYGASLDAVQITKLTANKVSLQLAAPVSTADMVNLLRGNGKYSKNAAADYTIILTRTDGKYYYTYNFTAPVKEGQKVITGKLVYAGKSLINPPPYKFYQLKRLEKGKTYTYTLKFSGNSGMTYQKKTIKCS